MFVGSTRQLSARYRGMGTNLDELKVVGGLVRVLGGPGSVVASVGDLFRLGSLSRRGRHVVGLRCGGSGGGGSGGGSVLGLVLALFSSFRVGRSHVDIQTSEERELLVD